MIQLDGSQGEGGGQILRSALALAICSQQPFRITNIRANRDKPGLLRQHLTAVKAAAEICNANVIGAGIGSRELAFNPGFPRGGNYSFAIGTAGSSTLVLQTVLPPLLIKAEQPSVVRISGGTHNRGSPPFDFLQRAFLPLLVRMGAKVELELRSHGFYPRGGGEIVARITPSELLALTLHERGKQVRGYAEAYVAALPLHIAQRELEVIGRGLNWSEDQLLLRGLSNDMGPGNAVTITVEYGNVTEVFTGFGERGVRAEEVASNAVEQAGQYLAASGAVGEHLADQLLLPMVLGHGGSFTTTKVTEHLRTNASVIEAFMGQRVTISDSDGGHTVHVR